MKQNSYKIFIISKNVENENVEKMEISDEEKENLRKYNKKYLEIAKIDN